MIVSDKIIIGDAKKLLTDFGGKRYQAIKNFPTLDRITPKEASKKLKEAKSKYQPW